MLNGVSCTLRTCPKPPSLIERRQLSETNLRAAFLLRVSAGRQAGHDVSIPDREWRSEAYCISRGYQLVEIYVEPGASVTNNRRPEFQLMIDAGTSKPASFDVVIVHSFGRFFRDDFELDSPSGVRISAERHGT